MYNKTIKLTLIYPALAYTLIYPLCSAGNTTIDLMYACAGKIDNGMVVTREFPSLHFSGTRLTISGSNIFSGYHYEICSNNEKMISFATQKLLCQQKHDALHSMTDSYGTLDKVSGKLTLLGAQDLSGEYACRGTNK